MAYSYVMRVNPLTGKRVGVHEHVFMYLVYHGLWQKGICGTPEGYEVHHKDFTKDNNDPDNLELLTVSDHKKLHWELNEPRREALSARMKEVYAVMTPEQRTARTSAAHTASLTSEWTDERREVAKRNISQVYKNADRHETGLKYSPWSKERTIFHIWDGDKEIATYEGWKAVQEGTGLSATKVRALLTNHEYKSAGRELRKYPYRITSESKRA